MSTDPDTSDEEGLVHRPAGSAREYIVLPPAGTVIAEPAAAQEARYARLLQSPREAIAESSIAPVTAEASTAESGLSSDGGFVQTPAPVHADSSTAESARVENTDPNLAPRCNPQPLVLEHAKKAGMPAPT